MSGIKLNSKEEVTSRPTFKPNPAFGNLCSGKLVKVDVVAFKHEETTKAGLPSKSEFAGLEIPVLRFEFINHKPTGSQDADRYFTHDEKPVNHIYGDKESTPEEYLKSVQTMFRRIVHIYKAFEGTENYIEFPDMPSLADLKLDPAKKVAEYVKFFEAVAGAFNSAKGAKPVYTNAKNESYPVLMKLIYGVQGGKIENRIGFPKYTGTGFIERIKANTKPVIEVKPNEIVEPQRRTIPGAPVANAGGQAQGPQGDVPDALSSLF